MLYISNRRPRPKPPQNNVMTISKTLKAVNDTMDWTVLFIARLLVMVSRERLVRYPALLAKYSILSFVSSIKMKLKEQAIKANI